MKSPDDASSPHAQNPFRAGEYFSLDVRKGVIVNAVGPRTIAGHGPLLQGLEPGLQLELGLQEEAGAATPLLLYSVGKGWGARYAKRHSAATKHFRGRELHEVPLAAYVQSLRDSWAVMGLGRLKLSFVDVEAGFILADVQDAPYSTAVGGGERPTDHLVAGVIAALITDIAKRDLTCVEISCKNMGDPSCKFVVGTQKRLTPAPAWVQQRLSVSEILKNLRNSKTS